MVNDTDPVPILRRAIQDMIPIIEALGGVAEFEGQFPGYMQRGLDIAYGALRATNNHAKASTLSVNPPP